MKTIEDRFQLISSLFADPASGARLKLEILDLIVASIEDRKRSLGYWEKLHLGGALSALSMNLRRSDPQYKTWLSLCMVNLDKAFVPPNQRNENYTPRYEEIEQITYEQLRDAAESLRGQIND